MPCCSRLQLLLAIAIALAGSRAGSAFAVESTNARPTMHAGLKAATEAALADQSLVLLIFGAEWCPPCQAMKKNTLASDDFLRGGGALKVTEVDIDNDEATTSRFGVSSVPTLFLLTGDGKIVSRQGGYLDPAGMLAWLTEGRRRAAAGLWEGSAPGVRLDAFLAKAAGSGLGSNDLVQLASMLGEREPGERAGAERLLLAQREKAVPVLIAAIEHPYLGQRIGASDALQRLIPNAPSVDPWLSLTEISGPVENLRQWWSRTRQLPAQRGIPTNDIVALGSIQAALDAIRSDDPIRRTDAMSTVARHGIPALPLLREAIKRSERTDPRTAAFLEDIRWTILVSDAVERRTGGVRSTLARGTSSERQAAAAKLGRAGREGIEALGELANDPDPLVVESAVRALSGVGGQDVLPALAALLKAADSNVRMTAAQALGRTRTPLATPHLLTGLNDPNEVVACAAVSALIEVNANDSPFNPSPGAREQLDAESIKALQRTLEDPRWRVRAAGVEAAGKLKITNLTANVLKLLDDPDGFVVKNTLVALAGLEHKPQSSQLIAVARRLPALQGDAVSMVANQPDDESVQEILKLFQRGSSSSQSAILAALGRRERYSSQPLNDDWKPVLTSALTIPDRNVREHLAAVLRIASPALAAEIVGPLIGDDDARVRDEATVVALGALTGTGVAPSGEMEAEEMEIVMSSRGRRPGKTNEPPVKPEQINAWHAALAKRPPAELSPVATALLFATGDSNRELPRLIEVFARATSHDMAKLAASAAIIAIAPRLSWPSSRPLLEPLERWPALYVQAVAAHSKMPASAAEYLLEPVRFRKAVEPASADVLKSALTRLLVTSSGEQRVWSLQERTEANRRIVAALADSTNAAWRAVSLYLRGRTDGIAAQESYLAALKDSNAWVRAAAAQALSNAGLDRPALEQRIGPLVGDENETVAALVAVALLERELRRAGGYHWQFGYFLYEDLHAGSADADTSSDDQGLPTILTNRPAYLEHARRQLSRVGPDESDPFILLLAQHGDFSELGKALAAAPESTRKMSYSDALLIAISMSRDPRHLDYVRSRMKQASNEWDLRRMLKAITGMSGPEARALRLDINRRLRWPGRTEE